MDECRTQIPAVCSRAMFSIHSGLKRAVKTRVSHLMGTLRHLFKASAMIRGVIFCGFLLFVASYLAASTSVSISAGAGPWQPSINPARPYGSGDQGGAAVFAVTGGQILAISASGAVDPDGAGKGFPAYGPGGGGAVGSTGSSGKPFPIAGAGLVSLVGAFTNASGVIVGGPIVVGNGGNFTAPVGASRLQLGVNDDKFSDNSGGFAAAITVTYTPPTAVIDPATQLTSVGATLNGRINPNGVSTSGIFEYGLTNAYGNTLGVMLPANNGTTEQTVSAPVIGLKPSTTYHYRLDAINSNVTVQSADATFTTSPPLILRADVNGDHLIDGSDISLDKTTSAAPFRFWLNDDHDVGDYNDGDDLNDGIRDCDNNSIGCVRDLEDLTMLNLQLPSSIATQLHYGAKIIFSGIGSGSLHLVPVTRSGFDYLYDQVYAHSLAPIAGVGVSKYPVSANANASIPLNQLFDDPQSGDRTLGFLLEGSGVGELVLSGTIIDTDGSTVAQTENFYLHLDKITQYYDHFTVGDSTQEWCTITAPTIEINPGAFSVLTTPLALHSNIANNNDSNQPYILFIHGWRMETWKRRRFAETALKRLYWAGYHGSFGLFSWPTEYVSSDLISSASDIDNYDRSEYQAWQSAIGLRTVLDSLESGAVPRTRLIAHSMGNVTASEALRVGMGTNSKKIDSYLSTQAATVAAAYDRNAPQTFNLGAKPDVYRYWTTSNSYFSGIASMTNRGIFSFCNPFDYALGKWNLNQSNKPDYNFFGVHDLPAYRYDFNHFGNQEYDKESANGSWSAFNFLDNLQRYEAFAFAVPSSSNALGSEFSVTHTNSVISAVIRLDHAPLYYGGARTHHSAEFLSSIPYQHYYWERALGWMGLGNIPMDPDANTPTSFSNWGQMWFGFSGANTTPQTSYAGDGVSNLAKYAFGMNPLQAAGPPPVSISNPTNSSSLGEAVSAVQGQIQITFWRRANLTDVSYGFEGSSDLKTWSTIAASLSIITSSGQQELVKGVIATSGAAQQYYRVRVTLAQ